MAFINDAALDAAANWVITNGTRLDICSSEPSTYGDISTASLGDAAVTVTGPTDNVSPLGRKVTVPAVSEAPTDANGTATHWALSNGTNTLVATGALSASKTVSTVVGWSSTAFDIVFQDA